MLNDYDFNQKTFIDFKEIDPSIGKIISLLKDGGAYANMLQERKDRESLERAYNNIFSADFSLDSNTQKSNLIRSHVLRTVCSIYMRTMKIPSFDVESVNRSIAAYDQKSNASIAKNLLEWFMRTAGYEDVYREGLEELVPYGDNYIAPFVIPIEGEDFVFPALEDRKKEDIMLDPACSYVTSESYSKQAQYFAYTQTYPEFNLVSRFGEWILDYAQSGAMVDIGRLPNDAPTSSQQKYWEVLAIQNKATKEEFLLVGANAFPIIRRVESKRALTSAQLGRLAKLPDGTMDNVMWEDAYKYKDAYNRPMLTLGNNYFYYRDKYPYNRGLAHALAIPQVVHEIVENLKTDNIIKRLDTITYITGGNADKNEQNFRKYRMEKRINRNAMLYLHSSMNSKNTPTAGILKFEGLTAQEGQQVTQDILDFVKNTSGVDPQQAEVQKNTALGQTEIIDEKSKESIEAVAETNMSNFRSQLNMFLAFIIAHKGFGLNDVVIGFTKFDEHTPEGNESATISVPEAAKKLMGKEFDFVIDKSTLVRRSRTLEAQQMIEFLGLLDPTTDPEGFIAIRDKIGELKGITMPKANPQMIAQSTAQGGMSQFAAGGQQGGAAPQEQAPPAPLF